MLNKQNLALGLVVVSVLLSVVAFLRPASVERVVENYGGSAGPTHTERQYFVAGFNTGGSRFATSSTATAFTLTSKEIAKDAYYIDWTPNINTTLTTMATTAMPWLGSKVGDTREFWLRNASTTAASTITLAAGTGVDLQFTEATGGDLVLNGLDVARLTFIRKNDSDVLLVFDEFTEAD